MANCTDLAIVGHVNNKIAIVRAGGIVISIATMTLGLAGCSTAPASVSTEAAPAYSPACEEAMSAAAAVAPGEDNNLELYKTADDCGDADSWIAAFRDHPDAGAIEVENDDSSKEFLSYLCPDVATSPVCVSASEKGYLS